MSQKLKLLVTGYRSKPSKFVIFAFVLVLGMAMISGRCGSDQSDLFRHNIGERALELTKTMVAYGPRVSGSSALEKVRRWIEQEIKSADLDIVRDSFIAQTPIGPLPMVNLSYQIKGQQPGSRVILLAHYESKYMPNIRFVGANDAASSVALLIALTPKIQKMSLNFDVKILFVDGEEAFGNWSDTDSLYGSRRYVSQLTDAQAVKAVVVVDMVGDKDLQLIRSAHNDPVWLDLLQQVLQDMGQSDLLDRQPSYVEDDHIPFVEIGLPILHLMDFTYGGSSSPGIYWHTAQDTVDNISTKSLNVVGEIILRFLQKMNSG